MQLLRRAHPGKDVRALGRGGERIRIQPAEVGHIEHLDRSAAGKAEPGRHSACGRDLVARHHHGAQARALQRAQQRLRPGAHGIGHPGQTNPGQPGGCGRELDVRPGHHIDRGTPEREAEHPERVGSHPLVRVQNGGAPLRTERLGGAVAQLPRA